MESTQISSKNEFTYKVLNEPIFDYKWLKISRLNRNFTQEEVAIQCGVSVNTISAIECGLFTPRVKLFIKLCWLLQVEPFELCHLPRQIYKSCDGKLR